MNGRQATAGQCVQCTKPMRVALWKLEAGIGRFCSVPCHNLYRTTSRLTRLCKGCGVSYVGYARGKLNYCTVKCRRTHWSGGSNPNWRGGLAPLKCRLCQVPFNVYPCHADGAKRLYCSVACKAESQRVYETQADKNAHAWRVRELRRRTNDPNATAHTEEAWRDLLALFNGQCARCGSPNRIERDHVIPLARGGSDAIDNIQPLCKPCNCRKWIGG